MTTFLNEPTSNHYPTVSLNYEYAPHHFVHLITPPFQNRSFKHYPLVVFIADNQAHLPFAPLTKLSQHGFTIAITTSDHSIIKRQAVCKIKTAIRFLMLHATAFMIDTNRVFIWGEKHGAQIGAQVLLTANLPEWNSEDPHTLPLRFRAGIMFGITDFQSLTPLISSHKRPPLYIYNGENDQLNETQKKQFVQTYQQINSLDDFILKNTSSGSAAFYTPYLLTIVENQIKKNL